MKKIIELLQRRIWLGPLIAVIVGLALGLLIGWVIWPVSWLPTLEDIAAVADSYAFNGDLNRAQARLSGIPPSELANRINEQIRVATAANHTIEVQHLNSLAQALGVKVTPVSVGTPTPTAAPTRPPSGTPTPTGDLLSTLTGTIVPAALILLIVVLIAAAGLLFYRRVWRPSRPSAEAPAVSPVAERARAAVAVPPATTAPGGLGRFVPTYNLGNDNYDTSYSLETPHGEFLGECGMGISETIGEGKPDKVTAFDLWLFDKADVRTVTQILMSEYAFNDQTLRTKLAPKGEAVLAEKGKTLRLETQSLAIDAQIVELVYATNPAFPANSHFQKLTVEIVPTMKGSAGAS